MSALQMSDLTVSMKKFPFSIATDGSNEGDKTQFPLVVRTKQSELGQVSSELFALPVCEGSATGENIFKLVHKELSISGIPWKNCIAFGSDNASVMNGKKKRVLSFVDKEQPEVFLPACTLHLVHIAEKRGAECLPPIDEVLVDVVYFFKKSTVRQLNLKDLQGLYDVEQKKMLKHGRTRWLIIGRCLARLLENWDPLKHFFHEEQKKKKTGKSEEKCYSAQKIDVIFQFLRSPTNRLYCLFLS